MFINKKNTKIHFYSIALDILSGFFLFIENAQNPYSATIIINEIEYGTGFAGSKRAAKMEAGKTMKTEKPFFIKNLNEQ